MPTDPSSIAAIFSHASQSIRTWYGAHKVSQQKQEQLKNLADALVTQSEQLIDGDVAQILTQTSTDIAKLKDVIIKAKEAISTIKHVGTIISISTDFLGLLDSIATDPHKLPSVIDSLLTDIATPEGSGPSNPAH